MKRAAAADRLQALYLAAERPMSAMIEIADRCNEVCVHCYQVQGQKGEMATDELLGAVDALADAGVLFLRVSGGEPTLRSDFLDVVRRAREREMAVTVFTNGLRIDDAMAEALAELRVFSVEISVYSHRADAHDAVTGVPGSWERTVAAIHRLRERGVHVVAKAPLMRANERDTEERARFLRSLGCEVSYGPEPLHLREDGARAPAEHDASAEGRRELIARFGDGGAVPAKEAKLEGAPCGACRNVHVEPNGEVRPCSQLDVPVGHVRDEGGVAAAFASERARFIRSLRWRDFHGCRDCDLVPHCQRCYADARAKGGDALGPYADACAVARARLEVDRGGPVEIVAVEGRDPSVGPYRLREDGCLVPVAHVRTEADEARARAHPWVRGTPGEGFVPAARLTRKRGHPLTTERYTAQWKEVPDRPG